MFKNIIIILLLTLFGCQSNPQYNKVMVNKTVKVFSKEYHDKVENYTFKWESPIDPNNNKVIFELKNDILIFTPKIVGNYEVNLTIEDISDEVVSEEIFYFKAVPETLEVSITEYDEAAQQSILANITNNKPALTTSTQSQIKPKKKENSKKQVIRKSPPKKSKLTHAVYAIQIYALPSLEEARKFQLELIDEGFDAYTQRYYIQIKDEIWYRVRVGNFTNKNKAIKVKKQIESITGITTWLDIVSTK